MEQVTLGKTGLRVSKLGLGAGGHSKIGLKGPGSEQSAIDLVRYAVENGVTIIDTAEVYGTEEAIGKALESYPAGDIVLSSKLSHRARGEDARTKTATEIEASLDASLKKLRRDTIDIYHVHGVSPENYGNARNEVFPVLENMRQKGKIRFIGITEHFGSDPAHTMLSQAVSDGIWDVIMIGFNILNPSARPLLKAAKDKRIGTLDMFAVRKALKNRETLREYLSSMAADGIIDGENLNHDNPFDGLIKSGGCDNIPEIAYRFCGHEPGIDVVLSGTGSIAHLESNLSAAQSPPLPDSVLRRFEELFGSVSTISGG
jgi:L-galactose dehydrogenase